MRVHALHPSVSEKFLFGHPHALLEQHDLTDSFLQVLVSILCVYASVPSHGRDTHEHIVEPHRVILRPRTGEDAVAQPVLAVQDKVHVVVDLFAELQFRILDHRLAHGSAYGAGIVKSLRIVHLLIVGRIVNDKLHAVERIVAVFGITSCLGCSQHGRIGDTPLVAGQRESARLWFSVNNFGRCVLFDKLVNAVQIRLNALTLQHAITILICWL